MIADVQDGLPWDMSDDTFTIAGLVTIAEIQTTTQGGSGPSPLVGDTVKTTGIVTAVENDGYYIQDGFGSWNGIYVYDYINSTTMGDEIEIEGTIHEYYEKTEIIDLQSFYIISSGNQLPDPLQIQTGDVAQEKHEGVLVKIVDSECVNTSLGYNEWEVNDGTGDCRIDDAMFSFSPTLNAVYNIIGVVDYNYDNFKVEPRQSSDIFLNPPQNILISVTNDSVFISGILF